MIGRDVENKNYDKINLIEKLGEKTMNTTLLIMAAGIGSRFGTGIKQLEPVGYTGALKAPVRCSGNHLSGYREALFQM